MLTIKAPATNSLWDYAGASSATFFGVNSCARARENIFGVITLRVMDVTLRVMLATLRVMDVFSQTPYLMVGVATMIRATARNPKGGTF